MKQGIVCGVGINDAEKVTYYTVVDGITKKIKDPIYSRWKSMIERCYSDKYQKLFPAYKDCKVCDEWLTFSNFRDWAETQNWVDKELDKDTLKGESKIYSPETCIYIDRRLNKMLTCGKRRGCLPLGVVENTKHNANKVMYAAYITDTFIGKPSRRSGKLMKDRQIRSSEFVDGPLVAHIMWLKCRVEIYEGYTQSIFDFTNYQLENLVLKGLIDNLKHYIDTNTEFTKLSVNEYVVKSELLAAAKIRHSSGR